MSTALQNQSTRSRLVQHTTTILLQPKLESLSAALDKVHRKMMQHSKAEPYAGFVFRGKHYSYPVNGLRPTYGVRCKEYLVPELYPEAQEIQLQQEEVLAHRDRLQAFLARVFRTFWHTSEWVPLLPSTLISQLRDDWSFPEWSTEKSLSPGALEFQQKYADDFNLIKKYLLTSLISQ